ncbi:hypothetical protein DQT93_21770, partial [Salmonella enterica]|nr:hypothetical protein [Salmonella enterica]
FQLILRGIFYLLDTLYMKNYILPFIILYPRKILKFTISHILKHHHRLRQPLLAGILLMMYMFFQMSHVLSHTILR